MSAGPPAETVALLRRRRDPSREAFARHDEERRAPLIRSIAPEIVRYERACLRVDVRTS